MLAKLHFSPFVTATAPGRLAAARWVRCAVKGTITGGNAPPTRVGDGFEVRLRALPWAIGGKLPMRPVGGQCLLRTSVVFSRQAVVILGHLRRHKRPRI